MSDAAITPERLRRLATSRGFGIGVARAQAYAAALEAARTLSELTTLRRIRHFLAQVAYDTAGFGGLVESLDYRDPAQLDRLFATVAGLEDARRLIADGPVAIANRIYAGRLGNGNEASGDGYRYRARGFLLRLGRTQYAAAEGYAGLALIAQPELLGQSDKAGIAAAALWRDRQLNDSADADDLALVTTLLVGQQTPRLDERRKWLKAAELVWPGQ